MLRTRLFSAAATLALFTLASWLPARWVARGPLVAASEHAARPLDLARPAIVPPESRPLPAQGPVQAVRDFFLALGEATAFAASGPDGTGTATPAGRPAAPPTPPAAASLGPGGQTGPSATLSGQTRTSAGGADAAFATPYSYLSPEWRTRLPFAAFITVWQGYRSLDLLAAIRAGHLAFDPRTARIFVETRGVVPLADGAAVVYSDGFYLAAPTHAGWLLSGGSLRREAFGTERSSAAPGPSPAAAAVAAARAQARAAGIMGLPGPVTLQAGQGPHLIRAQLRIGPDFYSVHLFHLVDGAWVVLDVSH